MSRWMILLTGLTACGSTVPSTSEPSSVGTAPLEEPSWQAVTAGERSGIETRFKDQEPYVVDEAAAAALMERCPVIRRVASRKDTETFSLVYVDVEAPAVVARVGAILDEGPLATTQHDVTDDGLVFAVGCDDCTVLLGIQGEDGRLAACTGPGYSLRLDEGVLTSR